MPNTNKFFTSIAFSVCASWAQFDVHSLQTRTVRAGQAWTNINTAIDELHLSIEVDRGVITTTVQVAYTPSQGVTGFACVDVSCSQKRASVISQDSMETSARFQLGDHSAITELFLWVGREKVRAVLQPRGLASAQYESIVRRRMDPALLETWGNGNYNLKVFPVSSMEQRRIEIVFATGMEDESGRFFARLPVFARRMLNTAVLQDPVTGYPPKRIGRISISAASMDGNAYDLNLGSLGTRTLGARPSEITAENLESLDSLVVSGSRERCRGCATPWISSRDRQGYFGLKTLLSSGTATFEAEPADRLVVLDVDNRANPKSLDYARKLALLILKMYGQAPYRANLGLRDASGLHFLFHSPRSMDAISLGRALEALRSAQPAPKTDFNSVFSALSRDRSQTPDRAAVVFLSDQFPDFASAMSQPYDPAKWAALTADMTKRTEQAGVDLRAANLVLFGYWNFSNLNELAQKTGGYFMGQISPHSFPTISRDDSTTLVFNMPVLFGPGRQNWNYYYYGWGADIADLRVTSERGNIHDLVVLLDRPSYGYYPNTIIRPMVTPVDPVIMGAPLAKTSDAMPTSSPGRDSLKLRISGQYNRAHYSSLRITGTWGGLGFEQTLQVPLPHFNRAASAGSSLWAYQQSEAWGRDTDPDEVPAFQKLARDYHVLNRQMSLLALEPGMELWDSLPNSQGGSGNTITVNSLDGSSGVARNMMVMVSDPVVGGGYFTLDSLSLDEILSGRIVSSIRKGAGSRADFNLRQDAGLVRLMLAATGSAPPQFEIMDLSGRRMARLRATLNGTRWEAAWNTVGHRGGFYAIAKTGESTVSRKFAVVR